MTNVTVGRGVHSHVRHERTRPRRHRPHRRRPAQAPPAGRAPVRLETGGCAAPWTYLVPPPDYLPDGPCTGDYKRLAPSDDETPFLTGRISYEDFSLAVADAIGNGWSGTHLIRT